MQSSSRNGHRVRVLAVHTSEGIMRAVDLRAWKSWPGSSHAAADETGVLLTGAGDGFVDYSRASWTLRSGNPWSENIELCGFAGWTRAQWLSRPKLLDACAKWLAARAKARGIPLVKLTPQQYRAGQSGVIGHHDHTVGYSDGTHWDPGPNFPWDVVLGKARDYAGGVNIEPEDDMYDDKARDEVVGNLHKILGLVSASHSAIASMHVALNDKTSGVRAMVARLLNEDPPDVDVRELASTLVPLLVPALQEKTGASKADVESAIREVLGSLNKGA